jgi:hypothetical protein
MTQDTSSEEYKQECLEVHGSAVAIRRMPVEMQRHAYETLARDRGEEYAERVRAANGLTRKLLNDNGMTYSQIRGKK